MTSQAREIPKGGDSADLTSTLVNRGALEPQWNQLS